nr:MAG TPA: hypothetical protein [Caudoviricetes sp.]
MNTNRNIGFYHRVEADIFYFIVQAFTSNYFHLFKSGTIRRR